MKPVQTSNWDGERIRKDFPGLSQTVKPVLLTFIFLCFCSTSIFGKEPASYTLLKKIELLKTSRQQIETLFKYENFKEVRDYNYPDWAFTQEQIEKAKRNPAGYYSVYYRLKDGNLDITYSKGECSEKNKTGYDVENDIAIDSYLGFFGSVKLSQLNLDWSQFKKRSINSDLVGEYSYDSEVLGIHLSGVGKYVNGVSFSPTASQNEKFSCEQ